MKLVDAMNTYNPSLIVLKELGFDISLIPSDDDDELGNWCAIRDDNEFNAADPLSLLGLASIWMHRGEEWKKECDENLYDDYIDKAIEE